MMVLMLGMGFGIWDMGYVWFKARRLFVWFTNFHGVLICVYL